MQRYYVIPSDFRLALDPATIVHGDALLGGTPFRLVRLSREQRAAVERWRSGGPVGADGALARALVHANLAQPLPPRGDVGTRGHVADVATRSDVADVATRGHVADVATNSDVAPRGATALTVVVPTRDRDVAALVAAVGDARVIVIDDGSVRPIAGAAVRHETPLGAGAARNAGARLLTTPLVAFLDSDTRPRPGWLDVLLPHFQDPRVALVAPRIVAARADGLLGRYEARHSPLDRGPLPARVVPRGRVPFVPGAALVMRTHLAHFDPTLRGGEDVDLVWRLTAAGHHVRYEPDALVEHEHRTDPRRWLVRRAYYGRTAAPLAKRHPNHARPLHMSPWTAATYLALATRHPKTAAAITVAATALLAKRLDNARDLDDAPGAARLDDARLAARLVAAGTLGARHLVADAVVRQYWPLAALATPRILAAAAMTRAPLKTLDAMAYGAGVWHGCLTHRTLDPLLPDLSWRMVEVTVDALIELAGCA
jgi:mycofactocin system glycosyltransferase